MNEIIERNKQYAIVFQKIGTRNLRISKNMYRNKRFPEAIYYLQQSVECNTKSFSAICCENEFNPKIVGHESINMFKAFMQDMKPTLDKFDHESYEILKSKMTPFISFISWLMLRGRNPDEDIKCAIKNGDLKYLIDFAYEKIWKINNPRKKTKFGQAIINGDKDDDDVLMNVNDLADTIKLISILGVCIKIVSTYPISIIFNIQDKISPILLIYILKIVPCSFSLSMLLDGHYESCRYPFVKDGNVVYPVDHYNKHHPIVKYYKKKFRYAKLLDKSVKSEQKLHLKYPDIMSHMKISPNVLKNQQLDV